MTMCKMWKETKCLGSFLCNVLCDLLLLQAYVFSCLEVIKITF